MFVKPARQRLAAILIRAVGPTCDSADTRAGLALLDRYVALLPEHADVLGVRGLCHFNMGDTEGAVSDLTRAIKIAPADPTLYFNRGTINLRSGIVATALEDLDEAVRLRPDLAAAWENRCSAAITLGRYQQGVDDCTQALRLIPNDRVGLLNRALAYLNLREYELSLGDADAAAGQQDVNGDALALRGVLRFTLGKRELAIQDLDASLQKPIGLTSVMMMRADVLARLGRTDDALRDLDSACRMQPRLLTARSERAALRLAIGDLRGAVDDLNTAITFDPRNPDFRYQRSYAVRLLGDITGSVADLDEGIRIDAKSSKGLRLRADVLKGLGRYQEALEDLNEAVRRSPMDAESLALRGFILSSVGRTEEGEEDFRKALSINAKLPSVYRLKGEVFKAANKTGGALSAYNQAVGLAPGDPEIRLGRGALLMQIGRYEAAIQDFDSLANDKLWRPVGQSMNALILFATGHRPTARLIVDAAIRENPIGVMAFFAYYARGAMNKGQNRCDLAVEDFSSAMKYAPDGPSIFDFPVLKERAACYIALKRIDLALNDIQRLLEKGSKNAGVIVLKGDLDWAQNDLEAALRDYSQAADIDSSNYDAHYGIAAALGRLARPADAIQTADKLIRLNPSDPRGFLLRATLYSDLGRHDKSLSDRIQAFRLEDNTETLQLIAQTYRRVGQIPDSTEQLPRDFALSATSSAPRILHARLLMAVNENAAAIRDLDDVIRRVPRSAQAYSLRAAANNALGDQASYERDLRKAIQISPNDHSSLNAVAYLLSSRPDKLSEARPLILRAMQHAPEDPDYLDTRGWIEYGLGNFAEARLYQRQAALGDSVSDPVIHDHLATILMHDGDVSGARREWENALKTLETQTPADTKRITEIKCALDDALTRPSSPASRSDLAAVKIRCDVDCVVALDNRDVRRISAGDVAWIPAFVGRHPIAAITWDGRDAWSREVEVSASTTAVEIALAPVRDARNEREKALSALRSRISGLQSTLATVTGDLTVARAEAAKAAADSPIAKRRRADELRNRLVGYIETLERVLSWETAEAARLESNAQQAESAGDSSTAGQLIGLIGKVASAKGQHSAASHRERAERVLSRIDQLTTALGKLSETDDIPEGHIPAPPSRFAVARKEGAKWIAGEVSVAGGDFVWKGDGGNVTCQCSELKSAKRGKEGEFAVEYGKTKLALRAAGADARDQLIEAWYIGCPERVAW
jgi:tetratricopeptide (TPR) repeat protein